MLRRLQQDPPKDLSPAILHSGSVLKSTLSCGRCLAPNLEDLPLSVSRSPPRGDSSPSVPLSSSCEIRLKYKAKIQWQVHRHPASGASRRRWSVCWTGGRMASTAIRWSLEAEDQSLSMMTGRLVRILILGSPFAYSGRQKSSLAVVSLSFKV